MEKQIKEEAEREKNTINIKEFINENFLYLPSNAGATTSQYKLLQALQERGYDEHQKNTGNKFKNLTLLNEERRRLMSLPPLTSIDYNCMERAA